MHPNIQYVLQLECTDKKIQAPILLSPQLHLDYPEKVPTCTVLVFYSTNLFLDMSIYGSVPSTDPMQLVVCKWCGRAVKDTAMLRHQGINFYVLL